MAKGRGRHNPYNRKAYQFTARRKVALKRAQAISARKRKIRVGMLAVGSVAAVGTALYLGRDTSQGKAAQRNVAKSVRQFSPEHIGRAANLQRVRAAVQPGNKEAVRVANAISPVHTPAQPGHIGPAPYPGGGAHVPGDTPKQGKPGVKLPNGATKGDTSTYARTDLGKENPQPMRDTLANEAAWREHMGVFEKYMDPGDKGITQRILAGQPVSRFEMKAALHRTSANKASSGAEGISHQDMEDLLDRFVVGGQVRTNAHGMKRALRKYPKATPGATLPNSGVTASEAAATTPTAAPYHPVTSHTPGVATAHGPAPMHVAASTATQGTGAPRGVPGTNATRTAEGSWVHVVPGTVVPGLGNAQSPYGTKVEGTGLTPAQKGAMTRARNKAKKAAEAAGADAKPATKPTVKAEPASAPAAQPHAPSAASTPHPNEVHFSDGTFESILNMGYPNWSNLSQVNKGRAQNKALARGFTISQSGKVTRKRGEPGYDNIP